MFRILGCNLCGLILASLVAAPSLAADKAVDVRVGVEKKQMPEGHLFRVGTIQSMKVVNQSGEDLGKIQDLVINMQSGKITYAALDFGGFLGIGDKLFAVPWHAFKYDSGEKNNDRRLVLDVPKERLKNAPGFDKNNWPDFANPNWSGDVDRYYGPAKTTTTTTTSTKQ